MFLRAKVTSVDLEGLNENQIKVVHKGVKHALAKDLTENWAYWAIQRAFETFKSKDPNWLRIAWDHEPNSWELRREHFDAAFKEFQKEIEDAKSIHHRNFRDEKYTTLRDLVDLWQIVHPVVEATTPSWELRMRTSFEELVRGAWIDGYFKWLKSVRQNFLDPDPQATQAREKADRLEQEEDEG